MAKKRRTFSREFKLEAVKLVTEQNYSFAEAARSLGITEGLLRKWHLVGTSEAEQAFPGHGNRSPFEEENRRLRAEIQRLQMERDILKKATVFFAKESQ
jgi:transposase